MGYDQQENRSSSGAVVAVLVAVLLLLVVGGAMLIGVGGYLWMRTARVQQKLVVELRQAEAEQARAAAEAEAERLHAEALAQIQRESAGAVVTDSQPDLTVNISEDGSLSLDGEPIDLDGLQERLAKLRDQSGTAVSVSLSVHPDCPAGHLQPLLTAFEEARVSWHWRGSD